MEWYWWVLIATAVVIIIYIKLKVFKAIMNRKNKPEPDDDY